MDKDLSRVRTEREVGGIGDTVAEASASQSQVGKEVWVLTGLHRSKQRPITNLPGLWPSSKRGSVNSRKDVSPDGTSPGQHRDIPKSQG